ncbi:hypothetical protein KRP22_001437 [Phytophthora ramorum]|uniref:uncharacterized protein n=1 Tax=Phytophthora ramorum TaxID=164328 RepID=UPI0030A3B6C6|nr:hypothetical protein KRP23_9867 [Phytophthora ramorum]KAH7504108.1 hypothetical protein KRP22_7154 [Phytophthora ramorum]
MCEIQLFLASRVGGLQLMELALRLETVSRWNTASVSDFLSLKTTVVVDIDLIVDVVVDSNFDLNSVPEFDWSWVTPPLSPKPVCDSRTGSHRRIWGVCFLQEERRRSPMTATHCLASPFDLAPLSRTTGLLSTEGEHGGASIQSKNETTMLF